MQKRILIFSDSHSHCGVGINMAALLEELLARGYETFCAQQREDTGIQRRLAKLGVRYFWFPRAPGEDIAAFINDQATPEKIFRETRPDLIFCANGTPAGSHGAIQAAHKLGIPYMIREGLVAEQFFGGNDGERAALRRNYMGARAVITKSRENLDFLQSRLDLPADFGRVIPNSAADAFFTPRNEAARAARRRKLGLSEEDILCFTAAGLRPVKGYVHQIQALRHLERHALFQRIKFAWAGDGPMREFLDRQIARFGFADRIHLLGHVADVAEWLDAADMFILPSLGEGMPGCVLEAMAKGVPVIATPAGGTPEALGDCGHLLPETEDENTRASALAEAILRWADDDNARRRAGERARARARARFTRAPMLKAYMESIEQLFAAL
ncbi:MAG: glycosyltransferase family 4 protein [Alphaproteobacteria bacterium]|jgi:glycosyltransferase involved in cell wall biosynthesis|nr:glycosyltransferase family 4 protein [Alphaproteobacteria bacterium]